MLTNKILEKELSYKIVGCIYNVFNKYGHGLKEIIYQKALSEEFKTQGLQFEEQKRINIHSLDSGKILGVYIPDFLVENKIVIEIKSNNFTIRADIDQQRSYLRASHYEISYLINFGIPLLNIKRSIFTNDRKSPFIRQHSSPVRQHSSLIRENSFTLLELLIVVALIAVIAVVAIILMNPFQQIGKTNDVRRKADLDTLKKAFENYYNDIGCYPTADKVCHDAPVDVRKPGAGNQPVIGRTCHICDAKDPLRPNFSPYMNPLPCDPQWPKYSYLYYIEADDCPGWFQIYSNLTLKNSDPDVAALGCMGGGCGVPPTYGQDYGVSSSNTLFRTSTSFVCWDTTVNRCKTCGAYSQCYDDPGCADKLKIYGSASLCCSANPGGC